MRLILGDTETTGIKVTDSRAASVTATAAVSPIMVMKGICNILSAASATTTVAAAKITALPDVASALPLASL